MQLELEIIVYEIKLRLSKRNRKTVAANNCTMAALFPHRILRVWLHRSNRVSNRTSLSLVTHFCVYQNKHVLENEQTEKSVYVTHWTVKKRAEKVTIAALLLCCVFFSRTSCQTTGRNCTFFVIPTKSKWKRSKVFCWSNKRFSFIKYRQRETTENTGKRFLMAVHRRKKKPPSDFTCHNWQRAANFTICCVHKTDEWRNDFWIFSRAANWNLGEPLWTGRMRVTAKGNAVNLKLEDKNTGTLYANCPVESYPGTIAFCVFVESHWWPWEHFMDDLRKLLNACVSFTIVTMFFFFFFAGVAIEAVSDSSRYFVIRVVDDNGTWPLEWKNSKLFLRNFLEFQN